ncbi:MAG: phosphatase PAP2 family protein [Rhodoferax sp.]|nr:phosphatase PAP2 family protein [Rhodoferax sp.]
MKLETGFHWAWWWLPPALIALATPLWLHWWEPQQFIAINTFCAPLPAMFWTGLSLLGNGWGILGVTAPLIVWAPRLLWGWLCAAPFAIAFARTGKFLIESPRPAAVVDHTQMQVIGEYLHNVSMPSGHTLTAFAVATGIFLAIAAGQRGRHSWLLVLALGTGVSRIAVGAHWPGDVAVGAALGLLAGMLGHLLGQRVSPEWMLPTRWPLRTVALLQAVALYHLLTEELDFSENLPLQYVLAGVVVVSLVLFVRQNVAQPRNA